MARLSRRGGLVAVMAVGAAALGCQGRPLQPSGGHGDASVGLPTPRDAGAVDAMKAVGTGGGATAVDAAGAARVPLGAACASDGACQSQFCVEGICCSSACTGGCLTCSSPGAAGTCLTRAAGAAPRLAADCPASAPATCGLDGFCDGAGACRLYPLGNVCVPGTCANGAITGVSVCDGQGACRPGATTVCAPFTCDPVTNQCNATCASDADCSAGRPCHDGTCEVIDREPCQANGECASGFCTDGVCCNTACAGPCLSCALPGMLGTCTPVSAGAADPRGICADQGTASCGKNGTCDGAGGCALYAVGTICAASSCTGGRLTFPRTCDGAGSCPAAGTAPCAPFVCNQEMTGCADICLSSDECVAGSSCVDGLCGIHPLLPPCTADSNCESGFCAQGVCCATKCDGPCFSCALPGTLGTCEPVPGPADAAACD